ncbi:hypothetical protein [Actinoplanes auranticolor]|uniref:Uncharacterized protein n=1 Tax=Actinoplanes auranticolor TaxID=47988 RepID=A0A919S3B0_9ACTN|nr:hypothetical protein [Actinoplanes auranticolor]GIM64004.1 hypothetical protein Aau02nite_07750 [Actinoplanes auranticolor]
MPLWEEIWRFGAPLVIVLGAAAAVSGAFSDPPDTFSRPHGWQWAWVGIWLMTVGDAAFGHEISWFERAWKGVTALLFAVAVTAAAWRHYRWRKRVRPSDDPVPIVTQPDS